MAVFVGLTLLTSSCSFVVVLGGSDGVGGDGDGDGTGTGIGA